MRTIWRDGMGRVTVRADTAPASRGDLVVRHGHCLGWCRADGWLQIQGPALVRADGSVAEARAEHRAFQQDRARQHWLNRHGPWAQRNRGTDPRLSADDLADDE